MKPCQRTRHRRRQTLANTCLRPFVLLASLLSTACVAPVDEADNEWLGDGVEVGHDGEDKIVGGSVDREHGSVVYVGADSGGDWCTGVLIGTRTVMTAAHCLQDYSGNWVSKMYVRFSNNGAKHYGRATPDPRYGGSQKYDIGIISLSTAVNNVKPSPYSATPAGVGERITVVGYGQTSPRGDMSKVRLKTTAIIATADGTYFTYLNPPNGYTCWGDSGAPDFARRGGVDVVVGIDSSGPCKPNRRIWDPQVSASADFIRRASGGNAVQY